MEFAFHIFDTESWDDIADTEVIKVDTSAAGSYTQTYDDSGEVLVDADGVKIVGKGLSADGSFWGPGVILYIENNTERILLCRSEMCLSMDSWWSHPCRKMLWQERKRSAQYSFQL